LRKPQTKRNFGPLIENDTCSVLLRLACGELVGNQGRSLLSVQLKDSIIFNRE